MRKSGPPWSQPKEEDKHEMDQSVRGAALPEAFRTKTILSQISCAEIQDLEFALLGIFGSIFLSYGLTPPFRNGNFISFYTELCNLFLGFLEVYT